VKIVMGLSVWMISKLVAIVIVINALIAVAPTARRWAVPIGVNLAKIIVMIILR
jgi:hypothetical protein